jgi:hypothetical protein
VSSADPGAASLATYLATIGLNVPAGKLADWMVLVPVLALELGGALSAVLVQAVPSGPAAPRIAPSAALNVDNRTLARSEQPESASVDSKSPATKPRAASKPARAKRDARRQLGQPTAVSKADAENKVVSLLKDRGGRLDDASVRGVAKLIGARKSTVHNALAALVAGGVVAKVGGALVLAA